MTIISGIDYNEIDCRKNDILNVLRLFDFEELFKSVDCKFENEKIVVKDKNDVFKVVKIIDNVLDKDQLITSKVNDKYMLIHVKDKKSYQDNATKILSFYNIHLQKVKECNGYIYKKHLCFNIKEDCDKFINIINTKIFLRRIV